MAKLDAYQAIADAWEAFTRVRALCPSAEPERIVGRTEYVSPSWYRARGITYHVRQDHEFTDDDFATLQRMTAFVNRSFVIHMAATLEHYGVVPSGKSFTPDPNDHGAVCVKVVKELRNCFAHGSLEYDPNCSRHVKTRKLLQQVAPLTKGRKLDPENIRYFPAAIDKVLEPLKDGVLGYIAARQGT
jgi:hypothetical protein